MTTAVAIPALPAHLAQYVEQHQNENAGAAGGIKAGSWPRISIGGSKFSIKEGGESTLICDPSNPQLPKMQLELVVVGHNPMISKTYYQGKWTEGDRDEPDCSSDDGIAPDSHVQGPQSKACATCPQNVWGSKISEQGKQVKACSDNKRLVVLHAAALDDDAYELSIKPGSLKDWALYVGDLNQRRIPVSAVVTLVFFDPAATYPKLLFKFGRYLTAEELAVVNERKAGDDVKLIASPRRTGSNLPAGTIPIQSAPAPAPAPAAPAPAAPPPQAPVDPYAGQPAYVKPAVDAAGGLATDAGRATYKALTKLDPPALAPIVATPPPPPPPAPVDPYAGLAAHIKPAVDAAGGLGTAAGNDVYKALAGKDAPVGVTSAPAQAAPTGRKKRTATGGNNQQQQQAPAPAPAPVAATPTPAAPAAAPAQSFSQAPAAQVATPGGGMDIEALLAQALSTPTA